MFSKNISYQNFQKKKIISKKLKFLYKNLIERRNNENNLIKSFTKSFSYSFSKKQLAKYKKYKIFQIYGMGGSSITSNL